MEKEHDKLTFEPILTKRKLDKERNKAAVSKMKGLSESEAIIHIENRQKAASVFQNNEDSGVPDVISIEKSKKKRSSVHLKLS